MGDTLYMREWRLQVGTYDLSELDLSFSITRDVTREPNAATIKVYNLKDREGIAADDFVSLSVGYLDGGYATAFSGRVKRVHHAIDGSDIVTTIEAKDAGTSYLEGELYMSFTSARNVDIAKMLVTTMGIGEGNLRDLPVEIIDSFVCAGPSRVHLADLLRATGHRYSIQDGALQIQKGRRPIQADSVTLISSQTGMIGSPTVTYGKRKRDDKLTVQCAIQAGCEPGMTVRIVSLFVDTYAEVKRVDVRGDTATEDWSMTLECKPL